MKKSLFVGGVVVVIVGMIGLLLWYTSDRAPGAATPPDSSVVLDLGDPSDAVLAFYESWHEAALSTTTDPQAANLLTSPLLSESLQGTLAERYAAGDAALDPVLCQAVPPPRIGTRVSFVRDALAEVHVLARGLEERSANFAVVQLTGESGEWQIADISCATGESGPEREFTFDREGFLLKSIPPPLNPEYWHLVFEQNGVNGYTAPLFFGESSVCVGLDGAESVCDEGTFVDATKALVQGEMTESGVNVARVTFLP